MFQAKFMKLLPFISLIFYFDKSCNITIIATMKANKLTIDLNKWTTQNKYAVKNGVRLNTISQQIKRNKADGKSKCIEYWDIQELGITLVSKQ